MKSRATAFALAAIVLIAAGIGPACVPGLCCPVNETASIHAQMPCCAGDAPTMSPREVGRMRPATVSIIAQQAAPAVIELAQPPAPVQTAVIVIVEAPPDSSPPLFLRNAQLLI
jgi:hypothetical protein